MFKDYSKPVVTRIELRVAEQTFQPCKQANTITNASCLATDLPGAKGCVRSNGTCLQLSGS